MDHYSILDPPSRAAQEQNPSAEDREDRLAPEARDADIQDDLAGLSSLDEAPPSDPEAELRKTLKDLAQRAQYLTGANGAAIALSQSGEIVCHAASGNTAPDLGARLQVKTGLTAECLRTGEALRCDNAELDPRVDLESCRRLGIESIIVMPIYHRKVVVGIFELFSAHAYSFQDRDVESVRKLAEDISAALAQAESDGLQILAQDAAPQPRSKHDYATGVKTQLQVVEPVERATCKNCGAPVEKNTVLCTQCGSFQADLGTEAPEQEEDERGWSAWKQRLPLKRLMVPGAFVALAIVVALVPLHRHESAISPPAVAAAPPPQTAAKNPSPAPAPPARVAAEDKEKSVLNPPASKNIESEKPVTTDETANTGLAASVRQLLAGVSSDFSRLLPINKEEEPPSAPTGDPNAKVWVDTRKGFYYCKGEEKYGKTGKGTYMIQKRAQADYFIPALMRPCP
jgi:putative methionine-R-sulfoxide reductase with GAF domain